MKVSVVLCTFNGEKYIADQLNSIINQTIIPDEIIICDDNSNDNTVSIIKKILINSGIEYYIHVNKNRLGVTSNFQKAIGLASGEIIFLSDQDDVWLNEKIEIYLNEFNKSKECVLIFSNATLVNQYLQPLAKDLWETIGFKDSDLIQKELNEIMLNKSVATGATMAVKASFVKKIIPFNNNFLHDEWIAINAPFYGKVLALNLRLIKYRQHGNNVVGASNGNIINKIRKYFKNIDKMIQIRKNKYHGYMQFLEYNKERISDNYYREVNNCILFWRDMYSLSNANKLKSLKIIILNFTTGNYTTYYTGVKGFLRDLISIYR